uniref:Ribosomal RNA methyltransferase FtsJ domain-containing protein n=1 Tax=viral metagenome TaxID=1070528 RepID=A0A6C0E394_9ZZZZ
MNYYILPKNSIEIDIRYTFIKSELVEPYVCQSLDHWLSSIQSQLNNYDMHTLSRMTMFINTYEFIYTNVPDTSISVSKIKPESNIFYELIELFHICNLNELLTNKSRITSMHFTPNYNSSCYFLNVLREEKDDIYIHKHFDVDQISYLSQEHSVDLSSDFLFFEFDKEDYQDKNHYFTNIIHVFNLIINYQNINGISIIKVGHIYHKVIIDILYVLSGMFDKIYIIKPSISNVISNDRYVVCKHFIRINPSYMYYLKETLSKLTNEMKNNHYEYVVDSLIDTKIPYYFINKIEESNVVIGQHQLENMMLIVNTLKNKNRDDKIEIMKRNNIQKSILWCEKYKIPHNKFVDKTNIFLHIKQSNENMLPSLQETHLEDCQEDREQQDSLLDIKDAELEFGLELKVFLPNELHDQIEIYEEVLAKDIDIVIETILDEHSIQKSVIYDSSHV